MSALIHTSPHDGLTSAIAQIVGWALPLRVRHQIDDRGSLQRSGTNGFCPPVSFAISITPLTSRLLGMLPAGEPPANPEGAFSDFQQAPVVAMAAVPRVVRSSSDGKACLRRSAAMTANDRVDAANQERPGLDGWFIPTSPSNGTTSGDTRGASCGSTPAARATAVVLATQPLHRLLPDRQLTDRQPVNGTRR